MNKTYSLVIRHLLSDQDSPTLNSLTKYHPLVLMGIHSVHLCLCLPNAPRCHPPILLMGNRLLSLQGHIVLSIHSVHLYLCLLSIRHACRPLFQLCQHTTPHCPMEYLTLILILLSIHSVHLLLRPLCTRILASSFNK